MPRTIAKPSTISEGINRRFFGVSPKPGYQSRYKNIEVEAIYSLVVNYPISSRWLITGRGKMLIE